MLFTDDVKDRFNLLPLELIDEYFTWDKLVKLLLDKDNRIESRFTTNGYRLPLAESYSKNV